MRLWPKSLLGQMLLAVALALLIAQTVSAVLLIRAGENRREQGAISAIAFRLVSPQSRRAEAGDTEQRRNFRRRGEQRRRIMSDGPGGRFPRALRLETTAASPVLPGEARNRKLEADLEAILEREGVAVEQIVVLQRPAIKDDFVRARPRLLQRVSQSDNSNVQLLVAGLQEEGSTQWRVARTIKPPPQRGALGTIFLQTILLFAVLMGLHFLLLRRITRPLAALTGRTESFGQAVSVAEPLELEGPEDVRRLITAHNAMESRIAGLLDEKDVMLGAIGHDLKTPLAALRVRIESVEDEAERGKMAASIEDITRSLDDILSLARVGRAGGAPEKAELSALTSSVVEEFEDMGKAVTLGPAERISLPVHVTWLKRGLRNLISNALRYAGTAEVSLTQETGIVCLRVDDNGPGIPDEQIADMLEPFTRGEASRNRDTGGAGLGLTLARAIAEQHGGTLALTNRESGGLRAEIRLPLAD